MMSIVVSFLCVHNTHSTLVGKMCGNSLNCVRQVIEMCAQVVQEEGRAHERKYAVICRLASGEGPGTIEAVGEGKSVLFRVMGRVGAVRIILHSGQRILLQQHNQGLHIRENEEARKKTGMLLNRDRRCREKLVYYRG